MVKRITVGAFEAKTHLSQLLTEVEKGTEVHITRRGELIAVMRQEDAALVGDAQAALRRLAGHRGDLSRDGIEQLISEGRDR